MEVILLERVSKLGPMGEVGKVQDGYARNFRLRQGKATDRRAREICGFSQHHGRLARHHDRELIRQDDPPRSAPDLPRPLELRHRRLVR